MMHRFVLAAAALLLAGCGRNSLPERAPYRPLAEVERVYGPLLTVGNLPTPAQHGTGERLGFFRDEAGTLWGLPLASGAEGGVLACAPRLIRYAPATGTFPPELALVGLSNQPTGWRGGTGELELVLRDGEGKMLLRRVHGARLDAGLACQDPEPAGPKRDLIYYRLAPASQYVQ